MDEVADPPPSYSQEAEKKNSKERVALIRNLVAFWFFGLCNNYGYVVMLSAATDILGDQQNTTHSNDDSFEVEINGTRACNTLSTGAVLLADIIPTLLVKMTAAFFMERIPYGVRIFVVILLQVASYLFVAFSSGVPMSLFGVVCASFSSGLGEITFLSMASHYHKDTISTWSSGTGGAGVVGAFAYAGIIQTGFSPKNTLLVMLVVPVLTAFFYWVVLDASGTVYRAKVYDPRTWIVPKEALLHVPLPDESQKAARTRYSHVRADRVLAVHEESFSEHDCLLNNDENESEKQDDTNVVSRNIPFKIKLELIKGLLKYMIPLGLVYMGEYFINQGLMELIYFNPSKHPRLSHKDQYRWYQVDYQLGVLLSRSSVNLVRWPTKLLPLLSVLQFVNAIFLLFVAIYRFVPSIWIVFVIVFYEGLLGGTAYVNTFYRIRQEVAPEHSEYCLGIASLADSTGIVLAGIISIPTHNAICDSSLPKFHY